MAWAYWQAAQFRAAHHLDTMIEMMDEAILKTVLRKAGASTETMMAIQAGVSNTLSSPQPRSCAMAARPTAAIGNMSRTKTVSIATTPRWLL
jgi:hypothetical protein